MSTLQVNEAGEMTAEISQTVMTEAESEPKRNDNSKPTSDAVETNSTHSIPDDRAVEEAKERAQNILDESIEAEEKAVASSPDGRFLAFDIEIGRGSFKTVFKGLDTETGVSVAWCELQDKYSKTERSRFKEEAVMLKQLTHPNIVKFHEFFERPKTGQKDKKQLILVTELMTSGTLKTYLKRFKGVREKVLKSWCRQILEGLYFLHTRTPPIIHRDLKCDNIFVNGSTGLIKIGDLGLATLKKHSFAKSVIGTPEFMAPEMYEERYDESVDVYAFGMCMLEMVTLEYPYMECQNAAQIYKRVTQGIPPDCLAKVQNIDIYDIIQGCTKYKKEERYTIPYLLKCPFFKLGVGIKVDLVLPSKVDPNNPGLVKLQLRLGDPKLRRDKHKDNEAIQFDFDLVKDNPEKISKELVSSGFIDENSMQLAAKTIKECVEAVKKQREKGGLEGKESEPVEKNHHSSESSHSVQTEEHGKSVTEEPSDPAHGRSAVASQSTKNQGQSFHQQPQSTPQVQSQQQQQQQPQQQQPRTEPESQEVRSRQNSTNEELAAQQAKVTASSVASKDSGISNTSVVSSVVSDDGAGQRLEPLHVQTTSADTKPGPASPDPEKILPTNTESSSTISEKASNETVGMSSSGNSSTISLPGSQPTSQTSTQQPAQQGQQVTQVPPGQSMGKTKKKERAFKLTLITVTGDEIECSFDTYKNYRITFKFDISEDESVDIAKMMIEAGHLRDANKGLFVERLRRILGDARSKKDADNGTVRYEHQTSLESNPGSAHTLPTPTEKNEAFQFPVSQPNVQSTPVQGTAVQGTAVQGTAVQGTAVQGTPVQGTPVQGTPVQGTPVQGTAVLQQGVATSEQDPVSQQPSAQVSQQPAKSQSTQQAVPAPETISQVTNPQQDQQVPPQVTKPAQQGNPQQNTHTAKPQAIQQVQQPTPQADQQSRQSLTNQATPQQVNQPVHQANQQTVPPANQQSIIPRASQQIVPKAEPQSPSQAHTGTITNQVNQPSISNHANPTVNSPTSFPQPLTPQPQDATTKSTTPTEVRTVVAKKKQFQVQVLQEPPNIPVTDLPIQPVHSNVPNNTPVNTNVAQGPSVNTGVPHDTKVSPVQEVGPSIVASQTTAQRTTTQQPGKSNAETSTENVSNEISSLPSKQPGAVTQSTNDMQNTRPNVVTTAPSSQTRTASPTQQHQSQVIPKPESPVIGRSDATQNTSLQTAGVQQATSTQTSLGQEANIESSSLTETRDTPQESIRVQSPISSHPPIYIPINPGETTKEKTIHSQSSVDNEKHNKYDEIVALTSSIETQTSFDKNVVQEQAKKLTERKTVEKSSSDEHGPDESDGSSDKSISRQSSDNSYSAQDVDINAGPKNIGEPQKEIIEQWINQICFFEGDAEGSNLSREDTDELKRLYKKQEKERDEMNKRQTKELNELYKKLEQRRNDKVPKDSKRPGGSTTKTPIAITQPVHEAKPSNGQNKTTLAKKQIHHSDENIKKLQQRSMQQFELDVSKKKGGAGTMAGVWSTNKQAFNQMKGPPVTTAMVLKGPRGVPPTSSSSMPHIPQSVAGYIPHSSSSMVFAPQQNNVAHSQVHTGVYWTNGANQNWPTNVETGNGRGQPVAYPDNTRHVNDMNSWQTNGPYHPVATQPAQISQGTNPPRTDGQMPSDNSKHVVLPSR